MVTHFRIIERLPRRTRLPALARDAARPPRRASAAQTRVAWQLRALGLVNRTVREINEMRYEFDEPFIVDASRA